MMCWRMHETESQRLHTSEFKVSEVEFATCTKVRESEVSSKDYRHQLRSC